MHGAQIVFLLPEDLDRAIRALAELNGRSLAGELRGAIDAYVQRTAALNDARPAARPGDAEPTPTHLTEAVRAG